MIATEHKFDFRRIGIMIAFVKGELAEIKENSIIIENHGLGYEIAVPKTVFSKLPALHNEIKIHTYMHVKEDGMSLFGFISKDDLNVFKLLITVNGIGPKGALGILSALSADDLRFAILAEDAKAIAKAPGIGAKTAGKLILELKDKFKLEDAFEQRFLNATEDVFVDKNAIDGICNEAVQALVALGYGSSEAMRAVKMVQVTSDMDSEKVLKLALKNISLV